MQDLNKKRVDCWCIRCSLNPLITAFHAFFRIQSGAPASCTFHCSISCDHTLPHDFLADQYPPIVFIAGLTPVREDGQIKVRAWLLESASRIKAAKKSSQWTSRGQRKVQVVGMRNTRRDRESRKRSLRTMFSPQVSTCRKIKNTTTEKKGVTFYLSVLIHEEFFLLRGILLLSVKSSPLFEPSRLSANKTGNSLANPILTNHSLYIFLASLPKPKNKNTKKPQARFNHRSYKT